VRKRQYICYVCKVGLEEQEKDFYPCNCKYQICFQCYYQQVHENERKCPNCHKHYEVSRVEEYKQSRLKKTDAPVYDLTEKIEQIEQNQSKIKTDEDIPVLKFQETEKLIET
jgi:hypothetical protein